MYSLPSELATRFSIYINILPLLQDIAIYLLFMGGAAFFLVALIKLLKNSPDDVSTIQAFSASEPSPKSPMFSSKDVISEIIDEGKQVFFGKKSHKPKSNVYRETVRQKSSMNLFYFLRNKELRKQMTKEDLYNVERTKESSKAAAPLQLSSDSETDSSERKAFYAEENQNFSESDDGPNFAEAEEKLVQKLASPVERRNEEKTEEQIST